jgi:dienelactone hydrolase
MVDRSRRSEPGAKGPRRLMVQVTYPRTGGERCRPSAYISPGVAPILAEAVGIGTEFSLDDIDTGICRGGAVAGGRRPVLLFSHAFSADRFVYATLINDLASRGYVVLAPDHPPDAFAVQYPGGKVAEGRYGRPLSPAPISEQAIAGLVELRAADLRFVLSPALKLAGARQGFLAGHLDGSRVGALGHSLGGATAARTAQLDGRIDAAVDLDGSLFGGWQQGTGDRTPFMLLAAEGGLGEEYAEQSICDYMAGLGGPRLAFQLTDALHFSYSDFQALAPELAEVYPEWIYAGLYQAVVGTVDPVRSVARQRRMLAAFFARHVRGGGDSVPRDPSGYTRLPIGACT